MGQKNIAAHASGTISRKECVAMVKVITEQTLDVWMIHAGSGDHRRWIFLWQ